MTVFYPKIGHFTKTTLYLSSDFRGILRSVQTCLSYSSGFFTSTDLLDDNPISGIIFLVCFWFSFCMILTNWYVVILEEGFREAKMNVKHIFENQDCILNLSRRQILTFMSHFSTEEEKLKEKVRIEDGKAKKAFQKVKNVNAMKDGKHLKARVYVRKFR